MQRGQQAKNRSVEEMKKQDNGGVWYGLASNFENQWRKS